MDRPLTVALIDDDPAVCDSTRLVLAGDRITAAIYANAMAFLRDCDNGKSFDCIISDVRMPGISGLELQSILRERSSHLPLILITGHGEVRMAVTALKAGAFDFIEKPFDASHLAASIRRAAAEARKVEEDARLREDVIARSAQLSARQYEVMVLVTEGYSNKQIAAKLGISARTVETYRLWVMEKMGAGSLAALVRMVLLLPPGPRGSDVP
jgi:two-component system, LuxR family, response regulator FixJ